MVITIIALYHGKKGKGLMDLYTEVWKSYFETSMVILMDIFLIVVLYRYFFKGIHILDYNKAYYTKREFVKKHNRKFDIAAVIIITLFISASSLTIYNHFMDLSNVINKNTKAFSGITISHDLHGDYVSERSIILKNEETRETLHLNLIYGPIQIGKCMKVEYFEYIKFGRVISESNCKNE